MWAPGPRALRLLGLPLLAGGLAPEGGPAEGLGRAWAEALGGLRPGAEPRRLAEEAARAQAQRSAAQGFPRHFVLDGLFPEELLRLVAQEVPDAAGDEAGCVRGSGWSCFASDAADATHQSSKSQKDGDSVEMMGQAVEMLLGLLRSPAWISLLQNALAVDGLMPDPSMLGSGIHNTVRGGYLKLHADFNFNHKTSLHRRVNVFVYLNEDWKEEFGGHLELWNRNLTRCGARVLPRFGRVVAFRTSDFSFHGHPYPLTAPFGRSRRSIAMYYYTTTRPAVECYRGKCRIHNTRWAEIDCSRCSGPCCPQACGPLPKLDAGMPTLPSETNLVEQLPLKLQQHLRGPLPSEHTAARMYHVANRDLAPGRQAPLAVLRGLLNESTRRSLVDLFEEMVKAGQKETAFGQDEVAVPVDHPAITLVSEAVAQTTKDLVSLPAYPEVAVVRRYIAPLMELTRHCDNAEVKDLADVVLDCEAMHDPCLSWLRRQIKGWPARKLHLFMQRPNTTRLRRFLRGLPPSSGCPDLPPRCFGYALCRHFSAANGPECSWTFSLLRHSASGCGSDTATDVGLPGRLPKRHAMFRSLSLSLELDEAAGRLGGELFFLGAVAGAGAREEAWPVPGGTSAGDAVLFDAGAPHALTPLLQGARTVLLCWFHSEPWGGLPGGAAQRAYARHVASLTNSLYAAGPPAEREARSRELKAELYRRLDELA